jgi:DNA polymerase-3 subunit delta'
MTGAARPQAALCAFAGAAQVLARLRTLSAHAPQSLVIEGGTEADRKTTALAWAATLNCTGEAARRPCCQCLPCVQIAGCVSRDLIVVDKQFFEDGDSKRSGVDKIRDLLPVWGQPPHGAGSRATIFSEAQDLNLHITNLLLKTLEEPRPGNVFVLLAPQRERLLQTLVSRSFVLTLPWPEPAPPEPDVAEWLSALLHFWDTGQGWFERTGAKGAADRALALRLLSACQRELTLAVSGNVQGSPAARHLLRLGPAGLRRFDLVLASAQEALNQPTVMPALVLDWIATAMIAKG